MHLSNFSGYQVDIKDTHILLILLDVNKLHHFTLLVLPLLQCTVSVL